MSLEWVRGRDLVIGSLFTGYGGLDQGAERALLAAGARSVRVAWVADIDPGASRILAHRYPGIPNLGDITRVDWSTVEPVDICTGGFPCQDVSCAGKRAGLRPDTRSGLWAQMAYAISILRPRLVVAENVRGLLSGPAHSDVEPCPWCLGDDGRESALRALGAVLGDLADIRYDAQWVGLRASDVGAPHARFQVFITAHPRDTTVVVQQRGRAVGYVGSGDERAPRGAGGPTAEDTDVTACGERWVAASGQEEGGWARPDIGGRGRAPVADTDVTGPQGPEPTAGHDVPARSAAPYATGDGRDERRPEPTWIVGGPDAPVGGRHDRPWR